ncbi:OmpH family outer membrane protein [Balneolales bacterium ANBcel1]|nr:OmpH family outer membrane protein [Balneolales bacterium ANBcel1]
MKPFLLTVFATLLIAGSLVAQPRIGYMNPQEVLDNLPERNAIERQLNRFIDQREQEFEERAIEFQNMLARFQQEAPDLSEAETRRRQQELQVLDQELSEFQQRIQRELEQRQSELLSPVLQEMNRIIEQLATEKQLDYVINEATSQGELLLLYVSQQGKDELDLTQQVIARMTN